jgi:hypothetical protein
MKRAGGSSSKLSNGSSASMAAADDGNDENLDNWKQFQGTELGSLLGSIYGNKTKINYPKPKTSNKPLEHGNFISGASVEAADPRKSTRRKAEIDTPSFAKSSSSSSAIGASRPVDNIPRRKQESVIRAELDDIRLRQNHYRPAYTQAISSEAEKQRFSEICTYKGGKGLPVVLPVSDAPFEIAEKARISKLNEEHRARRNGGVVPTAHRSSKPNISVDEQLAMQITSEIDDRRSYIEEMKSAGKLSAPDETRLKGEIASRLQELKRLDI